MGMRRAIVVLAAASMLALAGCTAGPPVPEPAPTPQRSADGIFVDATGESADVAAVTQYSSDHIVAGTWSVKTPDAGDLVLVAASRVLEVDETCFDDGFPLDGPASFDLSMRTSYDLDEYAATGDELASLVLVHPTGAVSGCGNELVAIANLDWGGGIPEPKTLTVEPGVVVATGSFRDGTGQVTGDVTITSTADYEFAVTVTGYSSSVPGGDLWASGVGYAPGHECIKEPWHLDWGPHGASDITETILSDDPSFIEAIIVAELAEKPTPVCAYKTVGVAALTWTIPDLRPAAIVRDQGAFEGAMGKVRLGPDSEPASYLVAKGDRIEHVSSRFDLSVAELIYLNPTEDITPGVPLIESGELLNLSKRAR